MSYKKVNVLPRLKPPIVHGRIQPINESIISDKETTKKKKKKENPEMARLYTI